MLSSKKLSKALENSGKSSAELVSAVTIPGLTDKKAAATIDNWCKGLFKVYPTSAIITELASALEVEVNDISEWQSSYKYAPGSARKARLVTELIAGRDIQDALDVLKFEHKRAARFIEKVLKAAIAAAEEADANPETLYVCEARVDGAGRRIGTKGWIAKDRGRAHPIRKEASHIYVTVTQE